MILGAWIFKKIAGFYFFFFTKNVMDPVSSDGLIFKKGRDSRSYNMSTIIIIIIMMMIVI